jgi:glycosyltransferase involved in cell wall biosynthesis
MTDLAFCIGNLNREHGGAQQLLYDIYNHLPGEFDCTVYHLFGEGTYRPDFEKIGARVINIEADSNYDSRAFRRLVEYLSSAEHDLLHTNSPISGVWGRVAARTSGIPTVVSVEHNMHHTYRPLAKVSNGLTLPLADVVVGVSEAVSDSILSWERLLLRNTHIRTIQNGVDVKAIRSHFDHCEEVYRRHTPCSPSDTIVGTVGRMTEQKGFEYLVRSIPKVLRRYPETRFVFLGDGPRRSHLEEIVAELGVTEAVHFTGYVPEVYPFFPGFTVGAFPSLWEGLPLAPAECMAANRPLVVTDIPPFRELMGDAGTFVPTKNPTALSEEISVLLGDRENRDRLGDLAGRRVADVFSIQRTVSEYESLYRELIGV